MLPETKAVVVDVYAPPDAVTKKVAGSIVHTEVEAGIEALACANTYNLPSEPNTSSPNGPIVGIAVPAELRLVFTKLTKSIPDKGVIE